MYILVSIPQAVSAVATNLVFNFIINMRRSFNTASGKRRCNADAVMKEADGPVSIPQAVSAVATQITFVPNR